MPQFDYFNGVNQQIGLKLGSQAYAQGEQMVKENVLFFIAFHVQLNKYVNMSQLKYYFIVNNSYVLHKIRLLVFPFRHKVA